MVQGVVIEEAKIVDRNPATGEIIGRIPVATPNELQSIIAAANDAQALWSDTPLPERIGSLKKSIAALSGQSTEIAELITKEMGKPIAESEDEMADAVNMDSYLDKIAEANQDEVLGDPGDSQSVIARHPLGVVAVMSPWNFPAGEIILLVLPALAAGNAVVVKPSEVSPLVGIKVVEALASALPPGVLQVIIGDGEVGRQLVENDGVHMVAMTGSSAVGRQIMSNCAPRLKRLVLELGGKDPMVVFRDANLDAAAKDAVQNSLFNTGQVCCSVERVYVDEAIRDDFENRVVDLAKEWKVGNGMDSKNKVGPMVSKMQRDHVASQVEGALSEGAKLLYRGEVPSEDKGEEDLTLFYPVTVLSDLKQSMDIMKSETFGPVIALSTFDGTESEAIKLANDTEYGLASYVYSGDLGKASRVARKIQSGHVGINCYSLTNAKAGCPWVGHKMSGFGYHSGMDGFRQFSVPKSLVYTTTAPTGGA